MGFYYTMGVNFDFQEDAQKFKTEIEDLPLVLTDGTTVKLHTEIRHCDFNENIFNVSIYPAGLQYAVGDQKKCSPVFFYEIRTQLYSFLKNAQPAFSCAFFEFEGADFLLDFEIDQIIEDGIGKMKTGDPNAASLGGYEPTDFYSKRFFDGLVLSNAMFKTLNDISGFEKFNDYYMWLPIKI